MQEIKGKSEIDSFTIREELELQGIKPKNHVLDQKRYIRELAERNRIAKEEREKPVEVFKLKRFQNVKSAIHQVFSGEVTPVQA